MIVEFRPYRHQPGGETVHSWPLLRLRLFWEHDWEYRYLPYVAEVLLAIIYGAALLTLARALGGKI